MENISVLTSLSPNSAAWSSARRRESSRGQQRPAVERGCGAERAGDQKRAWGMGEASGLGAGGEMQGQPLVWHLPWHPPHPWNWGPARGEASDARIPLDPTLIFYSP